MDSSSEARVVKRKRSTSPAPAPSFNRHTQTQLPHFHELNTKQQRHTQPLSHHHHPHSARNDDAEPYSRSLHSRSHSSTYTQHPSDSEREDHDIDTAPSPRQARSPYATSDLRGSPSIVLDPTASPSSRTHPLIAPRPTSSAATTSAAAGAASSSARYLGHSATPYSGLAHPSSHAYSSSSSRNIDDTASSPSASHSYRPRSPAHHHAHAASSAPAQSSVKPARSLAALESAHLSDLKSDLASITSPHQRASSTPQSPSASGHNMDASASTRIDDALDASSTEPSGTASFTPLVKKEHPSTPSEKPRGGQACLECRLAKVRCLPSDDSESCQRCQRFSFECLFVQHKRGRKPKSKLQGRDLTLLAEAAYATNASPVQQSAARPTARKSASASSIAASAPNPIKTGSASSAASPGVRWSSAPDSAFTAPPYPADQHEMAARASDTRHSMDLDEDAARAVSPASAFFSKKQPLSAFAPPSDSRNALDPKNLFGVDVTRMTQAMQQAMRSLERRRGAPYTLVTNNMITSVDGNDDDANSDMGATPPPPGTTAAADTNAVNESFELIAEQPLTLRVMLKPFEVSDQPDCETPGILADDRNPLATQATQPKLNDPITEGILTEPAARALFDLFMHDCNAWSGVFDPSLHTHDFVRKRSSFLYTVLLYVGSRYSKRPAAHHLIVRAQRNEHIPESDWDIAYEDPLTDRSQKAADEYARQIRRRIHDQARQHAANAFVDGDRTVLCCQAFFILASWKPLDDGLSVIQVGYAFRLAMDIQLHAEMPNCVKPNESNLDQAGRQRYEAVQRRFRNRQRTFLMLFVQDKSQQISNKITTHSISADNVLIRRCQTWWKHDGSIPTDAFVCASADIRRIQGKYVELYDRIQALTSATSDGPSIMMPAFLSDLYEWNARWHGALGLREDTDDDAHPDDPAAYRRRCQRLCLKLWKDNIKTYVSSLVLKSSLRQAALQEHQEIVRNHHRRSTTREKEERDSVSGKSHLSSGLEPGMVNLMAMPAFWPCVEGARGVLETLCAFPPERLLSAPDATIMQTTHAAVLLCSLATVKSQPPLGPGYLRSNIQLIDQTSAAFRRASITEEDTVLHIAKYLESLLRPKNAAPTHAAGGANRSNAGKASAGVAPAGNVNDSTPFGGQGSLFGNGGVTLSSSGGAGNAQDTVGALNGGAMAGGAASALGGNGFAQFTNFTLLSNNTDMFYSGNNNNATQTNNGAPARWFNNGTASSAAAAAAAPPAQDNGGALFFNNGSSFDREGLDAIASAAAAAAAAQNGNGAQSTAAAGEMNMAGVNWSAVGTQAPAWNSFMFGNGQAVGEAYGGNSGAGVFQQQQQQPPQQMQNRDHADETLRMLLRFLDG
ncbi:related to PRIB protein [Sporisorium reilianum SRZ2]|uniref:Related to PRIB protein n=1 Tax=Sporisorium reilianum (strain SRZ2) TaxID=999809 RepID=E6ZN64_SPORE|nr:related to PRIB protein [Sporisorium reilianum SRZ2]